MNKIRIGVDFDGVIAYNPLRLARAPITYVKRAIFGIKKLTFFVPKSKWQIWAWKVIHLSSCFPANGIDLLKLMSKDQRFEFHLITARFSFLKDDLQNWIESNNLKNCFATINPNIKNEQPHLFKERMVNQYNLDYFIDDNLNIVNYLDGKSKAKVFWINNIIDRLIIKDRQGFPYLRKALENISDAS